LIVRKRVAILVATMAACVASTADAHPEHLDAARVAHWWTIDPFMCAALLAAAGLYARGVSALWRRAGRGHGIRPWEAVAFAAGMGSLVVALVSPLDRLSDVSFAAHMAQHEILLVVAPALLVSGRSLFACLWGLPDRLRARVSRWVGTIPVQTVWTWLTAPFLALIAYGLNLWLWHLPACFEATLHNEWIHGVEHGTFFITASLFFWALIHGGYGRAAYGAAIVYVFLTSMHSGLLGALLTLAHAPWYHTYVERSTAWGIDPVEDQELAGLIMWIPASVLMVVLGLALAAAWIGESERSVKRWSAKVTRNSRVPR
jgi:putative membrane protein